MKSEMMKKKVIFFHPYFGDGGVERTNIRLSRYLMQHGYQIGFMSLCFKGQIIEEAKDCGIELIELRKRRTIQAVYAIRSYIAKQKKKYQVYVISCQNYANIICWFSLIGQRKDLKLIFTERNNPISLQKYSISYKDFFLVWLMKRIYRYADQITAISEELAEDLSRLVNAPVACVYNPTFSENFEEKAREGIDEEWFMEDIPIILSVGRFERQKDFPTLIHAFEKVRQKKLCRLVLVGEGTKRKELEELVDKLGLVQDVKFIAFDRNPYKYMSRATVFVVSSIYEGLCNTVIEATALHIPCVVTDCKSGPKEILLYGKGGKVVQTENVGEMAEAIEWVLENKTKADAMAELAYQQLSRFTADEVGKKYQDILSQ